MNAAEVLANLETIAGWDDAARRLDAAAALARQLGMDGADELTVRAFLNDAKTRGLLNVGDARALVAEGRKLAHAHGNGDGSGPRSTAPRSTAPHHVKVSHGPWYYAEGADVGAEPMPCESCRASDCARGVHGEHGVYAELPHCHARIVRRDGSGTRSGTSYLLSATPDGPRVIVSNAQLADGSWSPALGLVLADDPKVRQAASWSIRHLAEAAPEREAVPRLGSDGRIAAPPRESMPAGYLALPEGAARDEALGLWRQLAELAGWSPALADMLGASAFGPFIGPLRIQAHVLDGYGDSDRGKSTALRLAAAVWGDALGEGGVFRTWNVTPKGLLRFLGSLGILPAFFDESGMAGYTKDQRGQLIYQLTGGTERTASEYKGDGVKTGLPWSGVLIVTGNARISDGLGAGAWAGIPKRVIESPGPFTINAAHAEAIDELVPGCYGYPGAEILARYSVSDAKRLAAVAAELVGLPSGGNPRTWARELHAHVAGAMMLDEVFGTPGVITDAAAMFARAYLAEHCAEPEHDADRLINAIMQAIAREPARWPTRGEYRAAREPRREFGGDALPLPLVGVDGRNLAGVRDDAGAWAAVFPGVLDAELVERLGVDKDRALRELYGRGVLDVPEARRRAGEWQTPIRLMSAGSPVRMYRFALPPADVDQADAEPAEPVELPAVEPDAGAPDAADFMLSEPLHARGFSDSPATPVTAQVNSTFSPATAPATAPATEPATEPGPALCAACGEPLDRALVALGETTHPAPPCATATSSPSPAPTPDGRPTASASTRDRGPAFLVWDGGDQARAPEGELVPVPPGALAACRSIGDVAALALRLGARRLWLTRAAREGLGLPAELPETASARAGVPHPFTSGAVGWDIWPAEPPGLGAWMTVYRLPRSGEGAHVVFPEWLDAPDLDGPAFGELAPAELAHALTLVWRSTTFAGKGGRYGGVHFHHSPQSTFKQLVTVRMRRSRRGIPEAPELPPAYSASRRDRGVPLTIPGPHMAPAQEIPPGWIIAALDVRSCYASAARSTEFGEGEYREVRPGRLDKAPGVHLCSVPADAAAIHPALMPWFPAPKRGQREVRAWLDGLAAQWLAESGVPLRPDISYLWPDGPRVFDSPIREVLAARDQLAALIPAERAPAQLARDVITAGYQRFLGGWLGSDAWERAAGDWTDNRAWWLRVRVQAETRKQRNLVPMLGAGALVLGQAQVDTVWLAAPSLAALDAMPGTRGRPALGDGPGKFKLDGYAAVTPELAARLADSRAPDHERQAAIRAALDAGRSDHE